jgi:hypothetical protein
MQMYMQLPGQPPVAGPPRHFSPEMPAVEPARHLVGTFPALSWCKPGTVAVHQSYGALTTPFSGTRPARDQRLGFGLATLAAGFFGGVCLADSGGMASARLIFSCWPPTHTLPRWRKISSGIPSGISSIV